MSTAYHISLIGMNTPHHPDFVIDRPQGEGCYVLLCFSTPFFTRTESGIEYGLPGDCILYDPIFPQYHGTVLPADEGFRNDWMHFGGPIIPHWITAYELPVNQLIRTNQSLFLRSHFKSMDSEMSMSRPFWERKVQLILEDVFFTLGRYSATSYQLEQFSVSEREYQQPFIEARTEIHREFSRPWTVEQMGSLVNLSAERFSVLYQKFFRTSPKEDLIARRIEEAKIRLINSHDSMEVIAAECGFNSLYYFSKLFKKRIGNSPTLYRKAK
ncbi:hypothetical protein SY83_04490 [Paenibacillus swuensis]|uniref:HTH araC/xylS-type domain-containing protein n=1 Tax=Paenibacillus swuensis TaxID=1178515 RepID=A0A172TF88_9BACL|nr:AraC family transcriptional regulator [Paenibacillus swuensis]ANE45680.1 hypothetical protein SY83_04490 [Paenibacillus swuensis]